MTELLQIWPELDMLWSYRELPLTLSPSTQSLQKPLYKHREVFSNLHKMGFPWGNSICSQTSVQNWTCSSEQLQRSFLFACMLAVGMMAPAHKDLPGEWQCWWKRKGWDFACKVTNILNVVIKQTALCTLVISIGTQQPWALVLCTVLLRRCSKIGRWTLADSLMAPFMWLWQDGKQLPEYTWTGLQQQIIHHDF